MQEGNEQVWSRLGLLVAELFTALALIFMVATSVATRPPPLPTPPPTPTPTPALIDCGLAPKDIEYSFTLSYADALRAGDNHAKAQFVKDADAKLDPTKVAGLILIYGGGDNFSGIQLANGAEAALTSHIEPPITQRTVYKTVFFLGASTELVMLDVFYFVQSTVCT